MVKNEARLNRTFGALSDPTRRAILRHLARGPACAGDLAAPHRMSLPAVSKHLRVLETAGLIERERVGRHHRCRLLAEPLRQADDWISLYRHFWERQLDSLATYLDRKEKPE